MKKSGRPVNIAVDTGVYGLYTYNLPPSMSHAKVGCRVIVPFGSRTVTGYITDTEPLWNGKILYVKELIDEEPVLVDNLLKTLVWAADYYCYPPGEVFKSAHPPLDFSISAACISLTSSGRSYREFALTKPVITAEDRLILDLNPAKPLTKKYLLGRRHSRAAFDKLLKYGYIIETEEERVKGPSGLEKAVTNVNSADEDTLKWLARGKLRNTLYHELIDAELPVNLSELRKQHGSVSLVLKQLAEKKLIDINDNTMDSPWVDWDLQIPDPHHELTDEQKNVVKRLLEKEGFIVHLLHGVTGSGKTEVYMHVIRNVISRGKSAIVVVPEISLTPQLSARFRGFFGETVSILHSGLTPLQRAVEWRRLRNGNARIAIGARSAVFAPLSDPGVIIVDEEHDGSFKQDDGFRYNGRDLAIMRGRFEDAAVILGSATPSMETWNNALSGRYMHHSLKQRPSGKPLPTFEVVDLRTYKDKKMISWPLMDALRKNLDAHEQSLLFINRRGYLGTLQCRACGKVMECDHCSVSMTWHRKQDRLVCHYCGRSEKVGAICPDCGVPFSGKNEGTENILEYLQEAIPSARIARLDRDTSRFGGLEKIINKMREGAIDILLGTQMVTKGHDFPGVTLVGIIDADQSLMFQDFRAAERTFQLITQVGGRAGRGARPGKVIVQTRRPDHYSILSSLNLDYEGFARQELYFRKELDYPPWGHLVLISISDEDENKGFQNAESLKKLIAGSCGETVEILGVAPASVFRIKNTARWQILLKTKIRKNLRPAIEIIEKNKILFSSKISVDVDPVSML
ncbi:primosomal protein N' [Myxococcota bacterium]|nr:primosomal protein N' [Myxococcota bacterium]MBU1379950.1 primosomal protein N' [Myxococcota bacterium]MBU1497076.1 primosomal protein N' [Myxococcota bacterium]